MCDDCKQYIHNLDLVLKEVQDEVKKNKQHLVDYKEEFGESLQHNEMEIKQLLEAIEKRYENRMNKLEEIQIKYEKNITELNKFIENLNEVKNKNNEMCGEVREQTKQICMEMKNIMKDANVKQKKQMYSETVKMALPEVNKQIPVIVKPKEKQGINKTKEVLNQMVDPAELKITSVENRSNGTLIIRSENEEERNKIKNAIENKIGDNYEVRVANPIGLIIIITDITFKYTEMEIMEKLKKQNPKIRDSDINILNIHESKRNNRIIYNIKIKTDSETYETIMKEQKLNIGWEKCRVFDGTSVRRCYKCKGYNHKSNECKNQETCMKCHGNHKSNECNNEQIMKCINCVRVNKKLNLGLDENHMTNNRDCPVYLNKISVKKRRLGIE